MLRSLSIRDVVLISRLEITFRPGLGVLTGETGAGKSILLDALGLALGMRADSGLVRHGAKQASVVAVFDLEDAARAREALAEAGLEADNGTVILRRVLGADGRSRAFINDQPISIAALKRIGETLVEIHGQFESQRLLGTAHHRAMLDAYGGLGELLRRASDAYAAWREAQAARAAAEDTLTAAKRDEAFLRDAVKELEVLDPKPGEEASLAAERAMMMAGEKLLEALNGAAAELEAGRGVEAALRGAVRHLEAVQERAPGRLDAALAALERATLEAAEASAEIDRVAGAIDLDPGHLERAEERLFALRALARKHAVAVDALAGVKETLAQRLSSLEDGGNAVERLTRAEAAARGAYNKAAGALSAARAKSASRLDAAVAAELEPLKLGRATFLTRLEPLAEGEWGAHGTDRVAFEAATNPGAPPAALHRIASGGELARFMLALKVVLAEADPVPTLIFDEIDSGVGGAVAAAVGERLARLAQSFQVLGVTHSPQVAARGVHHWRVSKEDAAPGVETTVDALSEDARKEEIARMLAGARITDEARAAALSLLEGARS